MERVKNDREDSMHQGSLPEPGLINIKANTLKLHTEVALEGYLKQLSECYFSNPSDISRANEVLFILEGFQCNPRPKLYNAENKDKNKEFNYISGFRVPNYVYATHHIISAINIDNKYILELEPGKLSFECDHRTQFDNKSIKLQYGAAICRVVTLMQSNGVGNRLVEGATYRQRAQIINMPEELADLRNKFTHHIDLPSLSLFRIVINKTLDWLFEKYWKNMKSKDFITSTNYENELDLISHISDVSDLYASSSISNDHSQLLSLEELKERMK